MTENNGWRPLGAVDTTKNKTWDFKSTPEITGIYTSCKEVNTKDMQGQDRVTRVYTLETAEGPMSVWEKSSLARIFNDAQLGEEIHIVYKGEQKSTKNPMYRFHAFEGTARSAGSKEASEEAGDSELPFLGD